jgi:hypothetical protein
MGKEKGKGVGHMQRSEVNDDLGILVGKERFFGIM